MFMTTYSNALSPSGVPSSANRWDLIEAHDGCKIVAVTAEGRVLPLADVEGGGTRGPGASQIAMARIVAAGPRLAALGLGLANAYAAYDRRLETRTLGTERHCVESIRSCARYLAEGGPQPADVWMPAARNPMASEFATLRVPGDGRPQLHLPFKVNFPTFGYQARVDDSSNVPFLGIPDTPESLPLKEQEIIIEETHALIRSAAVAPYLFANSLSLVHSAQTEQAAGLLNGWDPDRFHERAFEAVSELGASSYPGIALLESERSRLGNLFQSRDALMRAAAGVREAGMHPVKQSKAIEALLAELANLSPGSGPVILTDEELSRQAPAPGRVGLRPLNAPAHQGPAHTSPIL